MKVLDCADVRDVAAEFAFGILDGEARADVVAHLDSCAGCRTVVTELAETADSVVLLAPEAEPLAGFERRVMTAIGGGARRHRARVVKLVAAVAAAAAVLSVVTVRIIDGSRDVAPTAAPVSSTVPMIGGGGHMVGQVQVVDAGDAASLTVTVDYALADGDYRLVLEPKGGHRQPLGAIEVIDGHGSWAGQTRISEESTDLVLLDSAGRAMCSATLPLT